MNRQQQRVVLLFGLLLIGAALLGNTNDIFVAAPAAYAQDLPY